jgi:hypothetical protein
MAILAQIKKQPTEIFPISIDYTGKLPTGTALLSGVARVTRDSDSADVTTDLLVSSTVSVTGLLASVIVQAGTDGERYVIEFDMTLDTGTPPYFLQDEIKLKVDEV